MRTPRRMLAALLGVAALLTLVATPAFASGSVTGPGYRLESPDGGVFAFGSAPFLGSGVTRCSYQCFGFASTPDGSGYWMLSTSPPTSVFGFGSVSDLLNPDPLATLVASDATGKGGWLLDGESGTVTAFGDAKWYGDATQFGLVGGGWPPYGSFIDWFQGIVGTPDGKGYWLVGLDGGVFAYGDAGFYGSMGGQPLDAPVCGMARTDDGKGYWLVSYDGGVFAFGDAAFAGSMGGKTLNGIMVSVAANPDGPGYWTAAMDGGVFAFGGAPFLGSMGGKALAHWIVSISATP